MNINSFNELELNEILKIAQDGEKKLKEMSDSATMIAEKWRVKSHTFEKNSLKNKTIPS